MQVPTEGALIPLLLGHSINLAHWVTSLYTPSLLSPDVYELLINGSIVEFVVARYKKSLGQIYFFPFPAPHAS